MCAYANGEILAGCWWGLGGGFEDFGTALGCDCKAGLGIEADGEGNMVTGNEAAAVGEEEQKGDGCGVIG